MIDSSMPDLTYPIAELIRDRQSSRAFQERPLEREKLRSILEAGRWAASCFNEQPWTFFVADRAEITAYHNLLGCLTPKNRVWAHRAPVLVLSVARLNFADTNSPNVHASHDVGMACAQMVLQAFHLGVHARLMAGYRADIARTVLKIPRGYQPIAMMALGYKDDPSCLPRDLRDDEAAPRERKPLDAICFGQVWGAPAGALEGRALQQ